LRDLERPAGFAVDLASIDLVTESRRHETNELMHSPRPLLKDQRTKSRPGPRSEHGTKRTSLAGLAMSVD
jgi:hypothetical protein